MKKEVVHWALTKFRTWPECGVKHWGRVTPDVWLVTCKLCQRTYGYKCAMKFAIDCMDMTGKRSGNDNG